MTEIIAAVIAALAGYWIGVNQIYIQPRFEKLSTFLGKLYAFSELQNRLQTRQRSQVLSTHYQPTENEMAAFAVLFDSIFLDGFIDYQTVLPLEAREIQKIYYSIRAIQLPDIGKNPRVFFQTITGHEHNKSSKVDSLKLHIHRLIELTQRELALLKWRTFGNFLKSVIFMPRL